MTMAIPCKTYYFINIYMLNSSSIKVSYKWGGTGGLKLTLPVSFSSSSRNFYSRFPPLCPISIAKYNKILRSLLNFPGSSPRDSRFTPSGLPPPTQFSPGLPPFLFVPSEFVFGSKRFYFETVVGLKVTLYCIMEVRKLLVMI